MTIAGIITMSISLSIVWGLCLACTAKLIRSDKKDGHS